jgi:acetyltransferase-like isoleucine patch superfamily enzyme
MNISYSIFSEKIKSFLQFFRIKFLLTNYIAEKVLTISLVYGPHERLVVSPRVSKANTLFNTRSGNIYVGVGVMFGHNCMVLTGYHDYSKPGETRERVTLEDAGRDIVIEDGVWIASGVIIIGPCRIGKNSVIASGSVVVKDIPPMTIAAGNPATVIKDIKFS